MRVRPTVSLCVISGTIVSLLSACALTAPLGAKGPDSNASFMEAWHTYVHCLSSKDPEVIVSDLRDLDRFADTVSANHNARALGILPYSLPPLPSRLAVDPAAMLSACANHGTGVALSLEQPRGSAELLITAVAAQNHFKKSND